MFLHLWEVLGLCSLLRARVGHSAKHLDLMCFLWLVYASVFDVENDGRWTESIESTLNRLYLLYFTDFLICPHLFNDLEF